MSSTRKAEDGAPLSPERFASSPEFDRGLPANLVARRCSVLDAKTDREFIWAIQYLVQKTSLKQLAQQVLQKSPDRLGTAEMLKLAKHSGQAFDTAAVRAIRREMPSEQARAFPLHGERSLHQAMRALNRELAKDGRNWMHDDGADESRDANHPKSYPVEKLLAVCSQAAAEGLEDDLSRLCLDPASKVADGWPWYFPRLVSTLRDYIAGWTAERSAGVVVTAIGSRIIDTLEYTLQSRTLTLVEGNSRMGKSFAARMWADQHPGQARFVEVPPGADDTGFFRALARGLGVGSFLRYKAVEIRARVESILLTGDVLLILDEAQRLWPAMDFRYGFAKRIEWVMAMANQGVPICQVSTPQYIAAVKQAEEKAGWNSAQLQGRLGHRELLPEQLTVEDLMAVAKVNLPEATARDCRALAAYARVSARYLAAIETISKRARFIAGRAGRSAATTEDIRTAMQESVIPSDSKLVRALESKTGNRTPRGGRRSLPAPMRSPQGREKETESIGNAPLLRSPTRSVQPAAPADRITQPLVVS